MAIEIQSMSGATISVATVEGSPTTYDAAGFAAKTYVQIGNVSNIGDIGLVYNELKFNDIGSRLTKKARGSLDAGTQTLEMAYTKTDAGQNRLRAAFNSDDSSCFKLVLQDGTIVYYTAKIMSAPFKLGSIDTIVMTTSNLGLDGVPLIV